MYVNSNSSGKTVYAKACLADLISTKSHVLAHIIIICIYFIYILCLLYFYTCSWIFCNFLCIFMIEEHEKRRKQKMVPGK